MTDTLPFTYPFDLSSLSDAGHEETFAVPEAAQGRIAEAYGVDGIEDFTVRIRLARHSRNEYALMGHFAVTIVQTCIVTLKPLRTHVEQDFKRRYNIASRDAARRPSPSVTSPAVNVELESEVTETLRGTSLDLAVPLLEEFSLGIDPYPRTPGVEFKFGSKESSVRESPFAVLQELKDRLEPPEKT